ncbi:MAG: peptide chain release factor 2 [bacterium]
MENKVKELQKRIETIKKTSNLDALISEKESLQKTSLEKGFWDNQNKAKKIMQRISEIDQISSNISEIEKEVENLQEYLKVSSKDDYDDMVKEYEKIEKKLSKLEFNQYLSGKYDKSSAILSIHAGQGGTEANDWAEILLRMYTRFSEKKDWKVDEIHKVRGEETGISTVTIQIDGDYAYGYLKNEAGTHRLVRLSPFNSQNLRQTSFSGVEVLPLFEDSDESDIEIKKEELEFKATKSGGPGGQNVNKTSTAVMITHIPTGITIHSSSQRSQLQNKEAALKLLKSKLWSLEEEKQEKEKKQLKGEHKVAAWGNQIRNYILHPYKLVKDLRTGIEVNNPEDILDGELDRFIQEGIKIQR